MIQTEQLKHDICKNKILQLVELTGNTPPL